MDPPFLPLSAESPTVTTPNLLRDSLHIGNLMGEIGTRPEEMMGTELRPVHEGLARQRRFDRYGEEGDSIPGVPSWM